MAPLLAAISAVDTIDKLASGAKSAWKSLSSARESDDKKTSAPSADSFMSLLPAHVGAGNDASSAPPAVAAPHTAADRMINRLA